MFDGIEAMRLLPETAPQGNHPTRLLRRWQEANQTLENLPPNTPREQLRNVWQAEKDALKNLLDSLRTAVPFALVKDGVIVAEVRTMGCVTSPGNVLNYSAAEDAEWTFRGHSLNAVDEIRAL